MSIVVAHVKDNIPLVKVSISRSDMERCRMDELNIPARGEQLGTDHYFPVGGRGMKNCPLQTF